MENKKLFLDIHAIQTLPPSNVNRDDSGSPKTAQYGGVTRARVSSQCWKKAMRDYVYDNYEVANKGVRTTSIAAMIKNKILELDKTMEESEAIKRTEKIIEGLGKKLTKTFETDVLFFISEKQIESLAKLALTDILTKKGKDLTGIVTEHIVKGCSADIALFGRMLATSSNSNLINVEATAQVAHAISTHAIEEETDFFVATDDMQKDKQGANMIGITEFNSSTMYRYANVSLHGLKSKFIDKEEFYNNIKLFLDSFINSMPTGKINTFGNQTFPEAIIISLREDRPLNLSTAFEEPIKSKNGYTSASIEKMFNEYDKYFKAYRKPLATYCFLVTNNEKFKDMPNKEANVENLIEKTVEEVKEFYKA